MLTKIWQWWQQRGGIRRLGFPPEKRPGLLMLGMEKRNQNFYRDLELGRRFATVWLTERFPFQEYQFDLRKIVARFFPAGPPAWIWLVYHHSYTPRLVGWEDLGAPVATFVGDPQDFIRDEPNFLTKRQFYRHLTPALLVNPYPSGRDFIVQGLDNPKSPIVESFWAIPPEIFKPLGRRRCYDIACLGAHTTGVYPFRRQVRDYLLKERRLKFFKKLRVGGRSGHSAELFARTLNRLRACFTCASMYGYTLAKYFEIPACGTVLFAEPTSDLEGLGFRDGENFVAVTPENFKDKMEYYLLGAREEMERLAEAGASLVHGRHTWQQRLSELLPAIAKHLRQEWPEDVFAPASREL
jgi:hypothetical protein